MKKLWGNVPGNTAVPSFLVPTLDLEELDKRISDLRAAESWLEVNLNLLRATIQGLEVQRHTIAAIRSLGVTNEGPRAGSIAPPIPSGLPPGWPVARHDEGRADARSEPSNEPSVADVAAASPGATRTDFSESGADDGSSLDDADHADEQRAGVTRKVARKASRPSASPSKTTDAMPTAILSGAAAGNWLGYMQDQFAKVAQAALASSPMVASGGSRESAAAPIRKVVRTPSGTKAATKAATKSGAKRSHAARKPGTR